MITNYMRNKVIEDWFMADQTKVTTYYLGVSSTAPTVAGTGFTEPTGNGYARVALTRGSDFTKAGDGIVKNKLLEQFPISTGTWANMTHWGIFDSPTGGNLLLSDRLEYDRDIKINMQLIIEANGITLTCS